MSDRALAAVMAALVCLCVALLAYALVLLVREATIDRGACLENYRVEATVMPIVQPGANGQVTIIPMFVEAHDECARWEFPEGRP